MRLTVDEIVKYAPYSQLPAFEEGFCDYEAKRWLNNGHTGLSARAYHLGFECALARSHAEGDVRASSSAAARSERPVAQERHLGPLSQQ
jgi:hypothetical protein